MVLVFLHGFSRFWYSKVNRLSDRDQRSFWMRCKVSGEEKNYVLTSQQHTRIVSSVCVCYRYQDSSGLC